MIAAKSKDISRGQSGCVRFSIGQQIARPGKRGIDCGEVARAAYSPMLCNLRVMNGQDRIKRVPKSKNWISPG